MNQMPIAPGRRLVYFLIASAIAVLFLLVVVEAALAALSRFHSLSRSPLTRSLARELYWETQRNIIQYLPETARFDPELAYTLRPGEFNFSNLEFDTRYEVNSLGLRDDEASLEAPRIVLVGDSMGMGWGVEQEESFAQLLEQRSGLKVLNAAISSYGTVRKMRMLEHLDLGSTRYLLIDYSGNDVRENLRFEMSGNTLRTMSSEAYQSTVDAHRRDKQYYPGLYLYTVLGRKLGTVARCWARAAGWLDADSNDVEASRLPGATDRSGRERNVELFLNVLLRSRVDLSGFEIIVFELNSHNLDTDWFIPLLRETIASGEYPDHIKRIIAIPVAAALDKDDFFLVDDHMTASGHEKVAESLLAVIDASPSAPASPAYGGGDERPEMGTRSNTPATR